MRERHPSPVLQRALQSSSLLRDFLVMLLEDLPLVVADLAFQQGLHTSTLCFQFEKLRHRPNLEIAVIIFVVVVVFVVVLEATFLNVARGATGLIGHITVDRARVVVLFLSSEGRASSFPISTPACLRALLSACAVLRHGRWRLRGAHFGGEIGGEGRMSSSNRRVVEKFVVDFCGGMVAGVGIFVSVPTFEMPSVHPL